MLKAISKGLRWIWQHLDNVLALLSAIACSYLGFKKVLTPDQIVPVLLGILALLAFGQIRAHAARDNLVKAAKDLGVRFDALTIATRGSLDDHVSYETDEREIIAKAKNEVWLIQETGSLLAERAKDELLAVIRAGGVVRLVVTLPSDTVARLMALRNANLLPSEIQHRSLQFRSHLRDIVLNVGDKSDNLTVRYIPYPIGWTIVMCDPNFGSPRDRKAVCRSAGFRVPFSRKYDFRLTAAEAPLMFKNFLDEVEAHYYHSSKVVFLTGLPRTGKTTMMKRALGRAQSSDYVYWVLSEQIIENGDRVGFAVRTSVSQAGVQFARREANDTYTYVGGTWRPIIEEIRSAYTSGKVIVLDEIGPIQFEEPGFRELITEIVDDPSATLIATIADPLGPHMDSRRDLEKLLSHARVSVHKLSKYGDESEVERILQKEIGGSIEAASCLAPDWLRH